MDSQGLLARRSPMPTPFAPRIILPQNLQTNLQALAHAHSTPQSLALRARIVLRAAAADTPNNVQIGRDLNCSNRTVGKWRRRYHEFGFAGLQRIFPEDFGERRIISESYLNFCSICSHYKIGL